MRDWVSGVQFFREYRVARIGEAGKLHTRHPFLSAHAQPTPEPACLRYLHRINLADVSVNKQLGYPTQEHPGVIGLLPYSRLDLEPPNL